MLYALSLPLMDIYSAESAPADAGPFICTKCLAPVSLRVDTDKRPHWSHRRNSECPLRRDAVTTTEYRARVAQEINTYAPTGAN
jgi:competence CoiA-like predicted nuclease